MDLWASLPSLVFDGFHYCWVVVTVLHSPFLHSLGACSDITLDYDSSPRTAVLGTCPLPSLALGLGMSTGSILPPGPPSGSTSSHSGLLGHTPRIPSSM